MLGRSLKDQGQLTKEQKEQTWAASISGSQAWMLINEPYNLIRDKLGIPRAHKSKHDFFNSAAFKSRSESAMACGTLYEEPVFNFEVKPTHQTAQRIDHTFELFLFKDDKRLTHLPITSTPDYFIKNEDGTYKLVGDIKCSSQADNEEAMLERYKWQALHNCYVLNCKTFELSAKGNITSALNVYTWIFTDKDFEWYENKLIEFSTNVATFNFMAYDGLAVQKEKEKTEGKELDIKPLVELFETDPEVIAQLNQYLEYKTKIKELESFTKDFEAIYKEDYDNLILKWDDHILEMKASETRGSIDYTKAIKAIGDKYNIPKTEWDEYRKAPTLKKTITVK